MPNEYRKQIIHFLIHSFIWWSVSWGILSVCLTSKQIDYSILPIVGFAISIYIGCFFFIVSQIKSFSDEHLSNEQTFRISKYKDQIRISTLVRIFGLAVIIVLSAIAFNFFPLNIVFWSIVVLLSFWTIRFILDCVKISQLAQRHQESISMAKKREQKLRDLRSC